ncbi:hypothetical protein HCN44_010194 [Aphidius gifuensis]|uniref:RING-type domain-containing protein n=1 Tax=Aphidius gifuensis TaxID=684658 RepID=A0A835CR52_APHGI|nr:hypothetical protein HCN44_010194 [Aphidius gifuensis]
MEETRMKWCDDLEKLLECPVCFERLAGTIYMCTTGHNICKLCFEQMRECGTCKKPFSSARNYLAEDLSMSLDMMKISMMDPNDMINKVWNFKKNSIGTQTDFDPLFSNIYPSTLDIKSVLPYDIPWGDYPCLLNNGCRFKESFVNMIGHFKAEHLNDYEEFSNDRMPFSKTWEFPYDLKMNYNKAFLISKHALFLLHIGIDRNGNLRSYITSYASGREARRFAYTIQIESGTKETYFFGKANSCRLVTASIEREGYFIKSNEAIFDEFVATKKLKISIDIEKRNVTLDEIRGEMSKKRDDSSMRSMGSENSLNSNSHIEKIDHVPRRRNRNHHGRPRNQSLSNQLNSNNTSPKPLMSISSNSPVIINHQQRQRSHEDQRPRRALSNPSSVNSNSQFVSQINIDTAASNSACGLRRRFRASRNPSLSNRSSGDNNSKEAGAGTGTGGAGGAGASIALPHGNPSSQQVPKIRNFRDRKPTELPNTRENSTPRETQNSLENKLYAKLYDALKNELGRGNEK